MKSVFLGLFLLCLTSSGIAYESPIKPDSPVEYTVKKGDTLWDISNRFLKSPWLWPELWHSNEQIHNPHLIFPGDVISLVYVEGRPKITVVRRGETGRTIKLNPKIRIMPTESAIPAIPHEAVSSFLKNSRVINNSAEMERAPYVLGTRQGRIASGAGDRIYAKGKVDGLHGRKLGIFRQGTAITNPDTNELLGIVAQDVAGATMVKATGGVATLKLVSSRSEVRPGDRVLPSDPPTQMTSFFPRAPDAPIAGKVAFVLGPEERAGKFHSVILNRGMREGLRKGDLLMVLKSGVMTDPMTGKDVYLPAEKVAMVMVYRSFEKLSYGIVLSSVEDIHVGDSIKSPE